VLGILVRTGRSRADRGAGGEPPSGAETIADREAVFTEPLAAAFEILDQMPSLAGRTRGAG